MNNLNDLLTDDLTLEQVIDLVETHLPGWWWKVGTCCVSDDACIAPDFNDPVHGERLKKQFPDFEAGSLIDIGFDIDQRPSGNVPLALLKSLIWAIEYINEEEGK